MQLWKNMEKLLEYSYWLVLREWKVSNMLLAFGFSFQFCLCVFSGQISVQRCILTVKLYKSRFKEGADAFIEEAVVRRELADNFCFYNQEHYDSIKGMVCV